MPPLTGVESDAAEQWLFTTLNGDATLRTALQVPAGRDFVFADLQPESGSLTPLDRFIVVTQMAATDVMVVGAYRIFSSLLFLVKCIGKGGGFADLKAAAARVDALLHRAAGAITTDGHTWGSYRERPFRLTEVDKGIQYRNSGGIYRLYTTS